MTGFAGVVAAVALLAGAISAIVGAGIGSLLIPLLALRLPFKIAVALAAVPHLVGALVVLWPLRKRIEWRVLRSFGLTCAIAAIVGAFLYNTVATAWLIRLFAALLVLAGALGLTGTNEWLRCGRRGSWAAGAISGFTGGLAGEQGGMRVVALLGFDLAPQAFVATSTAIAVAVDTVRAPVYFLSRWSEIGGHLPLLALMVVCVAGGAVLGRFVLHLVPKQAFSRIVSGVVLIIGLLLFIRPVG